MAENVRKIIDVAEKHNNKALELLNRAKTIDISGFDDIISLIEDAIVELEENDYILW